MESNRIFCLRNFAGFILQMNSSLFGGSIPYYGYKTHKVTRI